MPGIKDTPGIAKYDKLRELIPLYIITLFSLVAGVMNTLLEQDPFWAMIALFCIMVFAAVFTFYVEKIKRQIPTAQTILVMINGVLWIFVSNMKLLNLGIIAESFIALGTILWTFALTFIY